MGEYAHSVHTNRVHTLSTAINGVEKIGSPTVTYSEVKAPYGL